MSFSRKQQIMFRPLMAAAWKMKHPGQPWKASDHNCRNWYEDELYLACKQVSSLDCDPRRDFESVMAHFEGVAGGRGGKNPFYWNYRIYGAEPRRIKYAIRKICAEFDCDEEYMLGIARQALQLDHLPAWDEIGYGESVIIIRAIKIAVVRLKHSGAPVHLPVVDPDNEPF